MINARHQNTPDAVRSYHRLAISEKNNYLRFIHELGKTGLSRLFSFRGKDNLSLWWFSAVYEKSPLKSDTYDKLVSELFVSGKSDRHAAHKRLRDSAIYHFFSGLYDLFNFVSKSFYAKLHMNNFYVRRNSLRTVDYTIVSYFPLIDPNKAKEGSFENRYLAPFHRSLEKNRHGAYCHICLPIEIDGLGFKEAVKLASIFSQKQSIFLLEEFFSFKYFFSVFFYYIYFSVLFSLHVRRIKENMLYPYKGQQYNVWHIFNKDFYKSFCGPTLASSLWYIFVFKELTSRLKKNSKVISICEMQWWERALYFFARKNGLISIGYQHTIVPELLLNYFNDPEEFKEEKAAVESCPLPDYIATVGEIPATLFRKSGWPSNRIILWGAQRFDQWKDRHASDRFPWKEKEDYFVCAFSISPVDAKYILELFDQTFSKVNVDYVIYLKSHPCLDLEVLIRTMNIHLNPAVFRITETPLESLMKRSKGIIVTESSASLYALANGCPVVIPRFRGVLDCNPLSYISDIPVYADSPEELLRSCSQISRAKESPSDDEKAERFLRDYLFFPPNDDAYLDAIDAIEKISS